MKTSEVATPPSRKYRSRPKMSGVVKTLPPGKPPRPWIKAEEALLDLCTLRLARTDLHLSDFRESDFLGEQVKLI